MSKAIGSIDHVVIVVGDLEGSADIYRRLGFTLSPRGQHSAVMGTANHTLMLQDDYFELLTVLAPTQRNVSWQRTLSWGGGLAGFALQTEDPDGAADLWRKAGFEPKGPVDFSRPVTRADGSTTEARFQTVSIPEVPNSGMRAFVCSQPTRDAVWLPELMEHANTALAIKEVITTADEPALLAKVWLSVVPHGQLEVSDGQASLSLGSHALRIVNPRLATDRFRSPGSIARGIGLVFRVGSLASCRNALADGRISYVDHGEALSVRPNEACKVFLRFEES